MKNRWYCDNRDLVKWGTLVHLAHSEQIRTVIQVAFLRKGERPPLRTDQGEAKITQEVWQHLRDVNLIRGLGKKAGLDIVVLGQEFDPKRRREYIREVADCLKSRSGKKIVLLDPDTGIEPKKRASPTHVKVIEIQEHWEVLSQGDWLVLYQHASRKANWCECMRAKFAKACGVKEEEVKTFRARKIARDVAFFAANKR
jgi:hypothetical protein